MKCGFHRPAIMELYTYAYLRQKYDIVTELGVFDFVCIDFSKKELHVYEVKGNEGRFSKPQIEYIKRLLDNQQVRIFLVCQRRLINEIVDTIETPLGTLFIHEIKKEKLAKILQYIPVYGKHKFDF